jgi:hypothetical protein
VAKRFRRHWERLHWLEMQGKSCWLCPNKSFKDLGSHLRSVHPEVPRKEDRRIVVQIEVGVPPTRVVAPLVAPVADVGAGEGSTGVVAPSVALVADVCVVEGSTKVAAALVAPVADGSMEEPTTTVAAPPTRSCQWPMEVRGRHMPW